MKLNQAILISAICLSQNNCQNSTEPESKSIKETSNESHKNQTLNISIIIFISLTILKIKNTLNDLDDDEARENRIKQYFGNKTIPPLPEQSKSKGKDFKRGIEEIMKAEQKHTPPKNRKFD